MKYYPGGVTTPTVSRPPQGGRGLKSKLSYLLTARTMSPSARRARIEINNLRRLMSEHRGRPPQGGRGLKSAGAVSQVHNLQSPSARRARIEIRYTTARTAPAPASPSARRARIEISRNSSTSNMYTSRPPQGGRGLKSAGRVEQLYKFRRPPQGGRGLKSERADKIRNGGKSPSARRARIEIFHIIDNNNEHSIEVALRKEGAD